MKFLHLILIIVVFVSCNDTEPVELQSTVSIKLETAGSLSKLLSNEHKTIITNLKISGKINAKDFKCLRDELVNLSVLDLSEAKIYAYFGNDGTEYPGGWYTANEIPKDAFNEGYNATETQKGPKLTLTSVTLPNSLKSIGLFSFYFCSNLKELHIGSANQYFSENDGVIFNKNQSKLIICPSGRYGEYDIPSTVTTIGENSFSSCVKLTKITIPNSVKTIKEYAFHFTKGLQTMHVPSSVTTIEKSAFYGCGATEIIIPSSISTIIFNTFSSCKNLKNFTIPNSVKTIEFYALSFCEKLDSLTIGNSIKSIDEGTFNGCTNLKAINCLAPVPPKKINKSLIFDRVDKDICKLYVTKGSSSEYKKAEEWKDFKNIIER